MTSQQRTYLALGSLGVGLVGIAGQFGPYWALIVAGVAGFGLALLLAIGAVR